MLIQILKLVENNSGKLIFAWGQLLNYIKHGRSNFLFLESLILEIYHRKSVLKIQNIKKSKFLAIGDSLGIMILRGAIILVLIAY